MIDSSCNELDAAALLRNNVLDVDVSYIALCAIETGFCEHGGSYSVENTAETAYEDLDESR